MSSSATGVALEFAWRMREHAKPAELDAVLDAMVEHLPRERAEVAAQLRHHRDEAAKHQLNLDCLINGVGDVEEALKS